jgi:hypothetical protein
LCLIGLSGQNAIYYQIGTTVITSITPLMIFFLTLSKEEQNAIKK